MIYSQKIKPISYLKDNAAKVVEITRPGAPLVIARNEEALFLVQDIKSREQQQQTMALLKILALGKQQIERGEVHLARDVFAELDADIAGDDSSGL